MDPIRLRATDPHIGGWKLPLEFTEKPPSPTRAGGADKDSQLSKLREVAAELRAAAKAGNDPENPKAIASKWAILERGARSPEKWFPLRGMSVEVRSVNTGTAPSLRNAEVHVTVATIYARYLEGYTYVPRKVGAKA